MYLIFDTETTGLPKNYDAPINDSSNWPRLVQLAWQLHDKTGKLIEAHSFLIKPEGFTIPPGVSSLHGITTEKALADGLNLSNVLKQFSDVLEKAEVIAGHNIEFDNNIVLAEYYRLGQEKDLSEKTILDTKVLSTDFCALPGGRGGKFKWPTLSELHKELFGKPFAEAHNAAYDVEATARCFFELIRIKIIPYKKAELSKQEFEAFLEANPDVVQSVGIDAEKFSFNTAPSLETEQEAMVIDSDIPFVHLHVHTQYSILDGAAAVNTLVEKAVKDNMTAIAITDHGNMYGVKHFHNATTKAGIKPIIGCEVYMARDSMKNRNSKDEQSMYHLILLAKNLVGYHNLMKLVSYAWLDGFYYKPRIDKELLSQYREGLICCSACLGGELPKVVMYESEEKADEVVTWYKNLFEEDYYIEIQRHRTDNPEKNQEVYLDQIIVNRKLIELAKKHQVKIIATNDVHFINKEDDPAHDRLLCISTAKDLSDPNRMRYTGEEYLKTQAEMRELFADIPEALFNTQEIADKVEEYPLKREPIMPEFQIPESFGTVEGYREKYPSDASLKELFSEEVYNNFRTYDKALRVLLESDYLTCVVYEGARARYGDIISEVKERIDFELTTIRNMGFPGYFLIVWDFLKAAREMGVIVGAGRGSAAGSVVAYSLRITDIDPLKYNLLFERFLNPDRISMPDIDIDFDDDGRAKILNWVLEKYGKERVAHIITFGRMAAKTSIRDVARVQGLELKESDRLAKLVPERPGTSLAGAFKDVRELREELEHGVPEVRSVLENAQKLEGSIRNTGVHACGVIIGRDNLENYIPICTAKDSELTYVTQFDGKHVEDVGLLKMDFLGLKTLSIIKTAIENIKLVNGIDIDIDHVPLDDKETYELYSRGETTGLFQFESDGMKKYLKELKPTVFEDLIAMNALYRPGPMQYIPQFIARKNGMEEISYPIEGMEEYLAETYGITVYQEQVMLLSRKLANFTRGESDSLRKAMGKKLKTEMEKLKEKFFKGCEENGHNKEIVTQIWKDWESFAEYAFNKSHATCYSYISYQTAYLKTHYPAEYMAAVLSHNLNNIKDLTFFIDECNRMGIKVLGPSVNESRGNFFVSHNGEIRFGLNGIKGVGEGPTEEIIRERTENGPFENIVDFISRLNPRIVNKKSMESLAMSGAFDCFESIHRAQYFHQEHPNDPTFIEKLIRYGNRVAEEKQSSQISLFGDVAETEENPILEPPKCAPWNHMFMLKQEKELTGFYISGHPLDQFKDEIKFLSTAKISELIENQEKFKNRIIKFAAIISNAQHRLSKTGNNPYGIITFEDMSDSIQIRFFKENYLKYRHLLEEDKAVFVEAKVVENRWIEKTKDIGEEKENIEIEIRPLSVMLLDEAMNEVGKTIQICIDLKDITSDLTKKISAHAKKYKGNGKMSVQIKDATCNMTVILTSVKKVDISSLLKFLKDFPDIEYKVLTR
ncbi:MAG: DNA polymerase III subunit alpha [Bacteroidales bacterium]|jgi:DNA polymerase-3 subunit alpha|nr:DNA polymerase III subunit alpha [Bacteroidales bacterium]